MQAKDRCSDSHWLLTDENDWGIEIPVLFMCVVPVRKGCSFMHLVTLTIMKPVTIIVETLASG